MKYPLLSILAVFTCLASFGGQIQKTLSITFETDKYVLLPKHEAELKSFLNELDYTLDYEFIISGHTDNVGNFTYNDSLSKRRMNSIREYLKENEIETTSIEATYHGEHQPIKTNRSEEGRGFNRRVDLIFSYFYFEDADELRSMINLEDHNKIMIDPKVMNQITCNNGVEINIPANSFVNENGELIKGKIEFTIDEAIDMESFITNNLSTKSGGKLLESGGMMRIEAKTENGDNVSFRENSAMYVSVPTEEVLDSMQLFVSTDGKDWKQTGQQLNRKSKIRFPKQPNYPSYKRWVPEFLVDSNSKPMRPNKPSSPRHPHEPRYESYTPNITWYNFLFEKKIKEKYNNWYRQAVENYNEKVTKYDKRFDDYKMAMWRYENNIPMFEKELELWKDSMEKVRIEHEEMADLVSQMRFKKDLAKYKLEMKAWHEECDRLTAEHDAKLDALGVITKEDAKEAIRRYNFSVNNFGWFNCDRFFSQDVNPLQLAVWDNDHTDEYVMLVIPSLNSILSLRRSADDDSYKPDVMAPDNRPSFVFAFKVEDGKPRVYYKAVDKEEQHMEMVFETVTYKKFREILAEINEAKNQA